MMKKVYRYEENFKYWDRRWAESGRDADEFLDRNIYPIRYAEMVMTNPADRSVELGTGLGRVLKHYYGKGFKIVGLERSEVAVRRLKEEHPELDVRVGDVRQMPYSDGEFDVVLGFGLYHNLEEGLEQALSETSRCLRKGGRFCISMRPDNLEMNLNEWYWNWRNRGDRNQPRRFHKWLVGEDEFAHCLRNHRLYPRQIHRARNVSLLYRIPWLRGSSARELESDRRAKGYRLNGLGTFLDRCLVGVFPRQFCNVTVYIGEKGD